MGHRDTHIYIEEEIMACHSKRHSLKIIEGRRTRTKHEERYNGKYASRSWL